MFPLGTVLFPGDVLPLRVFEPRYQTMVDELLETGEPVGVVLIERGFEVGGGDQRFAVGTSGPIVAVGDLEGGHRAIVVQGDERFTVVRWLAEEPYPRAEVAPLMDRPGEVADVDDTVEALRSAHALMAALGHDLGAEAVSHLPADPAEASWRLASVCPVGALDAQTILETTSVAARLALIREFADDQAMLCRYRLDDR
jgi:uncharacterized protein